MTSYVALPLQAEFDEGERQNEESTVFLVFHSNTAVATTLSYYCRRRHVADMRCHEAASANEVSLRWTPCVRQPRSAQRRSRAAAAHSNRLRGARAY